MEGQSFVCSHCGAPIDAAMVDKKSLVGVCDFCGGSTSFRKILSKSEGVLSAMKNAVASADQGDWETAVQLARQALSVVSDNAPSSFIIGYYSAFFAPVKSRKGLELFFEETLPGISELEGEEEECLKQLLIKRKAYLLDYQTPILEKYLEQDSPKELAAFVEEFCPFVILKQPEIIWLDERATKVFAGISKKAEVPKTWYALFQSISKNPISPIPQNTFHVVKKTQRFYREYVLRIGEIFENIQGEQKAKFNNAFLKMKEAYEKNMNQAAGGNK